MRRLFRFKYPKIVLLMLSIIGAYLFFNSASAERIIQQIGPIGYLGIFIAGILFAFGFTTPLSVGLFLSLQPDNIILASLCGGLGALIGDLTIFHTIRISFMGEFRKLEHTPWFRFVDKEFERNIPFRIRHYLMYVFAGFLIASPLPDEVGVAMLAGLSKIKHLPLAVLSFMLNTVGILMILILSQ